MNTFKKISMLLLISGTCIFADISIISSSFSQSPAVPNANATNTCIVNNPSTINYIQVGGAIGAGAVAGYLKTGNAAGAFVGGTQAGMINYTKQLAEGVATEIAKGNQTSKNADHSHCGHPSDGSSSSGSSSSGSSSSGSSSSGSSSSGGIAGSSAGADSKYIPNSVYDNPEFFMKNKRGYNE